MPETDNEGEFAKETIDLLEFLLKHRACPLSELRVWAQERRLSQDDLDAYVERLRHTGLSIRIPDQDEEMASLSVAAFSHKGKGKRSREEIASREIEILEVLIRQRHCSFADIAAELQDAWEVSEETVKQDIQRLKSIGLPIETDGSIIRWVHISNAANFLASWHDAKVIERINRNQDSKQTLAKRVVDYWIKNYEEMHQVMLGAGTMVLAIYAELLGRFARGQPHFDTSLAHIYTSNLLVLEKFIDSNVDDPRLEVMPGTPFRDAGTLCTPRSIQDEKLAHAVIMSFYAIDEEYLYTGQEEEVEDKLANLLHPSSKRVLIALEWEKIGRTGFPVVDNRTKQLVLPTDKKEYIVFTNQPDRLANEDERKLKIMGIWEDKGITFRTSDER